MMPSKSGLPDAELGYQSFIYSLFLYPVFISMWYIGYVSIVGVLLLTAISIIYSYLSWVLYRKVDIKSAKTLMFSSFAYLPLALFILLIFKNL